MIEFIKQVATWGAAIAGAGAALLWYKASVAEYVHDPIHPEPGGRVEFFNGDHRWDPIRTAELQTKWNRRAAAAAAVAAILQATTLVLPG